MTENQLLEDRVLIKPETEEVRASGLFVAKTDNQRPVKGEVVLVGPGTNDITMIVNQGDKVMYGEYSGVEVEIDGEKLLLMRQGDIFMITNKKK